MTSKREELDNNKEMNKLLKDNSGKMEIAKTMMDFEYSLIIFLFLTCLITQAMMQWIPMSINTK